MDLLDILINAVLLTLQQFDVKLKLFDLFILLQIFVCFQRVDCLYLTLHRLKSLDIILKQVLRLF